MLYKKGVYILVCMVIFAMGAILGLTILSYELSKDTNVDNSVLIVKRGG
eukprot:UN20481